MVCMMFQLVEPPLFAWFTSLSAAIEPNQFVIRKHLAAFSSEEIEARGGIVSPWLVEQESIKVLEPEQAQAAEHMREPAGAASVHEAQEKELAGPGQSHSRTANHSAAQVIEMAKEAPESEVSKAGKIITAMDHLLHKGGFGIDQSRRLEHAFD